VAVSMALGKSNPAYVIPQRVGLLIAVISLATTTVIFLMARGILKLIPVICGLIAGYLVSIPFGIIDFSIVADAPWIAIPKFAVPQFNIDAVAFLIPAAVAPLIAHFGDILVIGEATEKDYLKEPGINRCPCRRSPGSHLCRNYRRSDRLQKVAAGGNGLGCPVCHGAVLFG